MDSPISCSLLKVDGLKKGMCPQPGWLDERKLRARSLPAKMPVQPFEPGRRWIRADEAKASVATGNLFAALTVARSSARAAPAF